VQHHRSAHGALGVELGRHGRGVVHHDDVAGAQVVDEVPEALVHDALRPCDQQTHVFPRQPAHLGRRDRRRVLGRVEADR